MTQKKRMLITGVSGLLGNNLAYYFRNKYRILGLYLSHPVTIKGVQTEKVDILSQNSVRKTIKDFKPDVVIHCASLTDVDFCENNRTITRKINIEGCRFIGQALKGSRAKLVYISSDSVYDGKNGNFSEVDPIRPKNYYGLSKYKGELEILKHPDSLVLRTNIFGWNIQNKSSIAEWILEKLKQHVPVKGFRDAEFSSVYTFKLAQIMDAAIRNDLRGVYNCASRDAISKYEFAVRLARSFKLDPAMIRPISIDTFGFKASRGKNLSLDTSKLRHDLHCALPTVQSSLDAFRRDFRAGLPGKIRALSNPAYVPISIPYGHQTIDALDKKAVVDVLSSDWVTQGPKIKEFEDALCAYTGAKYSVVVSSGTAALHVACLAAGINPGDEVITSPLTFVASANCALFCGGLPVFADIRENNVQIDPTEIAKAITKKTKAIIPVHFAGLPCDMQKISALARKNGLMIIEDAAHALGASYRGSRIGSCKYSDMAIFSFHPVKSITTGEGGAIMTNSRELYERMLLFRNHGITRKDFSLASHGPWYYEMQFLGYNYRLTDIQAGLGVSQMKKLDGFISRRRKIAAFYDKAFSGNPYFDSLAERKEERSAYHLYPIILRGTSGVAAQRKALFEALRSAGIGVQVHYIPVHLQPFYRSEFGYSEGDFPRAEDLYNRIISLPIYPSMKDSQVRKVAATVIFVCKRILEK